MRSFKRYLVENDTSHFFKTQKEIMAYVDKIDKEFLIRYISDNTLECFSTTLRTDPILLVDGYIPVQFAAAMNYKVYNGDGLKSLVGSPRKVSASCEICVSGNYFSSLIGCPISVASTYTVSDQEGIISSLEGICQHAHTMRIFSPFKTWHNVHKEIKEIEKQIGISNTVKECLLGFLNIKGKFFIVSETNNDKNLENALSIINNHLQGDKDMLDCQEELITAGLKDFAKL